MDIKACKWHFFLAHAGADIHAAESLYSLLVPHCKVFLDSRCLLLGDDWEEELPKAQRKSLITIVLVSYNTHEAYYQREEIAGAIEMARINKDLHRVVPVFLEDLSEKNSIPYGLRLKHGLSLSKDGGLQGVSQRLLDLLKELRKQQNLMGTEEGEEDLGDAIGEKKKQDTYNPHEVHDPRLPHGLGKPPDNNPIEQTKLTQNPHFQPPPFGAHPANSFMMRCVFANDPNAYFITNTNLIVMFTPFGQSMIVGRRIPPIFPNLAWMYQTNFLMHGVTFEGYILARFPNGQTLQIGYVTNP